MSKKKLKKVKKKKSAPPAIHPQPTPRVILRGKHILERGRDLDKLVAQEVLEWKVQEEQAAFACKPMEDSCRGFPPPFIICKVPDGVDRVLPLFSTSDQAALDLFKMLRADGRFCCLRIDSDYNIHWDVSITICKAFSPALDDEGHLPDVIVSNDSFPKAMCLAALEVVRLYERQKVRNDELRESLRSPEVPNCS
jgi:hypothetical protein